jgi:pyruvate,water dikinase
MKYVKRFEDVSIKDVGLVGGKNASLGEMIGALTSKGVLIPSGFAVTAEAYRKLLSDNKIEEKIKTLVGKVSKKNLKSLATIGTQIRRLVEKAKLPEAIKKDIVVAYKNMSKEYGENCSVAVRSSATAEDLPGASFAGQQETYLNIKGEKALLSACMKAFASLFTDRAIIYRMEKGFDHMEVALSIGVQKMIRSDKASAGVVFTLDTETGFKDVVFINSSYGLGESVVKGTVNPDEFYVHKPTLEKGFKPILKKRCGSKKNMIVYSDSSSKPTKTVRVTKEHQQKFSLSDDEILELASQSLVIEKHYSKIHKKWMPMDIEWAKDGIDGKIYIVQARPETVHAEEKDNLIITEYVLPNRAHYKNKIVIDGKSIGRKIVSGTVRIIKSSKNMHDLRDDEILVTDMTDPDWVPIMKHAGAIITNRGGRTCHAAIVSRELGIAALVGTCNATSRLKNGQKVTLDCSNGEVGIVYDGILPFKITERKISKLPRLKVKVMMNLGDPDEAFRCALIPNDGVGLARLEFIIGNAIQIHPMALVSPEKVVNKKDKEKIEQLTHGYKNKKDFFVDSLAREAGTIAAAFYPNPVIIRLSDFKSNEYRQLIGGSAFEPTEENPMIGFRGASRYCHDLYREAFALECQALKKIREEMGLDNVKVMVPFVRTVTEAKETIKEMARNGLKSGQKGLEIIMMCEIPSNVILIDEFSKIFDGFSIGSNDLTQTTLAVDRDSELVAHIFDERDEAVMKMLSMALKGAKKNKKPIGICGQAPSDYPEIARFLVKGGISSLSLNPDTVLKTMSFLGK